MSSFGTLYLSIRLRRSTSQNIQNIVKDSEGAGMELQRSAQTNKKFLYNGLFGSKNQLVDKMQIFGIDILQVVAVIVALTITYIVARVLKKTLKTVFKKTLFPEDLEKGITKISKYVVYLVGLFVIISIMGVDITSILVGLGAFSIAISFATSTIIQNFVSGILVLGDQAFMIGDKIKIQNFEGKVTKIGIRTTILEDEKGNLILIPNSLFINNAVIRKESDNKN